MTEFIITICVVLLVLGVFGFFGYRLLDRLLKIKEESNEIKLKELYGRVDTEKINIVINTWLTEYINTYIVFNIRANNKDYITEDDSNNLIKECTKEAVTNLSNLYKYYISLLIDINSEDAILKFIYDRISQLTLTVILEFNKPV